MRVLLLEDHEYRVSGVVTKVNKVGCFVKQIGGNVLRYPAGTMVDVSPAKTIVIGGQDTGHKLLERPTAWVELITRDEADKEQRSLHIDLNNSFDYCKSLEDRARDAEYEARECRSELEQLYSDLLSTQASIIRITSRITAMGVMRSERMETRTETGSQTDEEDSQAARSDNG